MSVPHCISIFEGTFYKKLQDTATTSFVCYFTSAFTSADIILNNFSELHLTLSEKRVLSQISLF